MVSMQINILSQQGSDHSFPKSSNDRWEVINQTSLNQTFDISCIEDHSREQKPVYQKT
jgi:hypothetical protein